MDAKSVDEEQNPQSDAQGRQHPRRVARQQRIASIGKWLGGVTAGVLTTAVVAWLVAWGLIPNSASEPKPQDSSPVSDSSPQESGDIPITFTAVARYSQENGWVVPRMTKEEFFGPNSKLFQQKDGWKQWANQYEATAAGRLDVDVTVQGKTEAQVVIHDLRVRVLHRNEPSTGTHVHSGGGGATVYRWIKVDLDMDPPTHRPGLQEDWEDLVPLHERRPIKFPYEVSRSDAESFTISAYADQCDCQWVIDLEWASEGKAGIITIDENGQPFRLAGTRNVSQQCVATFAPISCEPK